MKESKSSLTKSASKLSQLSKGLDLVPYAGASVFGIYTRKDRGLLWEVAEGEAAGIHFLNQVYGANLLIVIGDVAPSMALAGKCMGGKFSEFVSTQTFPTLGCMMCNNHDYMIWLNRKMNWPQLLGVLAHEVYHYVEQVCKSNKIPLDDSTEEVRALLQGWAMERFLYSLGIDLQKNKSRLIKFPLAPRQKSK